MSDKSRWNNRYRSRRSPSASPAPWLLEHQALLPAPGLAFDIAMGLGGSAGWLIQRGWRAAGADISEVAVRSAKGRWPALLAFVADLEQYWLPEQTFDLIVDFRYLNRALFPQFRRGLKPGGLLLIETFVRSAHTDPDMNPAYLLEPGELSAAFNDWDILDYREGERNERPVAGIVAR